MSHLVESAKNTLQQLDHFLGQIEEKQYNTPLPLFSESTVGMHVRHIIEFYQCLVKGVQHGEMDYDARERSHLQETNIEYAKECIQNVLIDFGMMQTNKPILLKAEQKSAMQKLDIESNIYRELLYVIEHTIHHLAIIKMGCMSAFPGIQFHRDFGVAYSTIKFRDSVYSNLSA
jgi:uncharacterized damage-inducible protein DinB